MALRGYDGETSLDPMADQRESPTQDDEILADELADRPDDDPTYAPDLDDDLAGYERGLTSQEQDEE